jgi:hypothetical protein
MEAAYGQQAYRFHYNTFTHEEEEYNMVFIRKIHVEPKVNAIKNNPQHHFLSQPPPQLKQYCYDL